MLLRARTVYPVSSPPIEDGAVIIQDDKILEVGSFRDLSSSDSDQTDLGEVFLMPGLINAHCHLDYTGMAGMIPPPNDFLDWIEAIIAIKASWDYSDFAKSWIDGANQLLASGTTTVADMEAVPELVPEVWNSTPLRIHTFMELINVRGQQSPADQVEEAVQRLRSHPNPNGGLGLSPHALYSTNRELLAHAKTRNLPLSIHVAESGLEDEMFRRQSGRMHTWLERNGRDMDDCRGNSPVQALAERDLLGPRTLAVHCNYLNQTDIELLARSQTHVIHCPNSHAYFKHAPFKAEQLIAAGINIALGTDSLASTRKQKGSNATLDVFNELKLFATTCAGLSPETIVETVTTNGARALGLEGARGQLSPGAAADIIAFDSTESAVAEIITSNHPNLQSMIAGRWRVGRHAG